MQWLVKYGHSDKWDLNFPPQWLDESDKFNSNWTMADVLVEAIEAFLLSLENSTHV